MARGATSLLRRLLGPLWLEDGTTRRERRCEFLVSAPVTGLAGLAWGALAAPEMGLHPFSAAAGGTVAFLLFLHLQGTLRPVGWQLVGRRLPVGPGPWSFLWETAFGGTLVFLLTRALGAPVFPSVAGAAALGAAWAFVIESLLCGDAVSRIVELAFASPGSGTGRKPDWSHAAALAQRGDREGAASEYRTGIGHGCTDPIPYLRLAELYGSGTPERPHEGIAVLEAALEHARLSPRERAYVARRIAEICRVRLCVPERAAPILARLAEAEPRSEAGVWAREELTRIKEEMLRATEGFDDGTGIA